MPPTILAIFQLRLLLNGETIPVSHNKQINVGEDKLGLEISGIVDPRRGFGPLKNRS